MVATPRQGSAGAKPPSNRSTVRVQWGGRIAAGRLASISEGGLHRAAVQLQRAASDLAALTVSRTAAPEHADDDQEQLRL